MTEQPRTTSDDSSNRQTRRRLIQAGLIGVPMLLTLTSRPAFGGTTYASGAMAEPQDDPVRSEICRDQLGSRMDNPHA